ncbi:hypothetical protein [Ferruginibacter sp. HRS2-29]|uniref:hypothetical protein n=1 Tax=Ferruginibacter sp. HRS2-29 TaxID=2487334 RepID=UPI0020CDCD16|nr:hypothetical protein [Ferruginibacter sp. HRS2-29]MCP9750043.1 hypothetical protein [Ferruginibacter sp. HRS2-29]
MIKNILVLLVLNILVGSIYDYTIPTIEGNTVALSSMQGKKMLFVTLPITEDDASDSMLSSLDSIATLHSDSLAVIASPSYEDGYTTAQKDSLRNRLRIKLSNAVIITDGIYTRKTSGTAQQDFYQWLTQVSKNTVLDIDVDGPGYKYFVNKDGELYGVLRSQTRITSSLVDKLIRQ